MRCYPLPFEVQAFTVGKEVHGTEPGIDAREVGIHTEGLDVEPSELMIPRQTHSTHVAWVDAPGEIPDTDAVITSKVGLFVGVKTADCIPVLLYDSRQHIVAAVHAGWRGTVGRIVEKTIAEMNSQGCDLYAVIGPGISLDVFEVGDEVYEAFRLNGFPMERIAQRRDKWHLNLWDANRWLLEIKGVNNIYMANECTFSCRERYYSARRDGIHTGRNLNCIRLQK